MKECRCGCKEPRIEHNFYAEARVRCPVCDRKTHWHPNRWNAEVEWEEIQR